MFREITSLGVDSGQIALLANGPLIKADCHFPHTDGILLSDSFFEKKEPTVLMYGKDFKHWEEIIPRIGKSANQARKDGDAVLVSMSAKGLLPYTYEGCSLASLSDNRVGKVGDLKSGVVQGVCISAGGDGYFPLLQRDSNPDRYRLVLDESSEWRSREAKRETPIRIPLEKDRPVIVGDPCYFPENTEFLFELGHRGKKELIVTPCDGFIDFSLN